MTPGFEPGNQGLQTHALPLGYVTIGKKRRLLVKISVFSHLGAEDEARTRYLHLGKVALYQMSYSRNGASDRNRTNDTGIFSPCSKLTELQRQIWRPERARTVDSSVTG